GEALVVGNAADAHGTGANDPATGQPRLLMASMALAQIGTTPYDSLGQRIRKTDLRTFGVNPLSEVDASGLLAMRAQDIRPLEGDTTQYVAGSQETFAQLNGSEAFMSNVGKAAGAGADTIYAGAGDDVVNAGAGDDTVFAGTGNDMVAGYDGDDFIDGGAGDDWLDGGAGNDSMYGGGGDDVLAGGEGDDWLAAKATTGWPGRTSTRWMRCPRSRATTHWMAGWATTRWWAATATTR
ncbi:hemolysin-type calcium-binding protein, partial [Xanthomonas citri pv. citri]